MQDLRRVDAVELEETELSFHRCVV